MMLTVTTVFAATSPILYLVVGLSAAIAVFGLWLMLGQGGGQSGNIQMRLSGVKLIKRYEMGDSLAKARDAEARKKDQRREAIKKKAFSDIPVLDHALQKTSWAESLDGKLLQCQMPMSVTAFLLLCSLLGAMGAASTMLWRGGFDMVLTPCATLLLGGAPYLFVLLKVHIRIKKFGSQLPDALDLISSSVKGGQSLNAAVQNVADEMPEPICDEFRIMSDELMFGVTFETVLQHLVMRVPTSDVRFFASALLIQKETGGNLSEVLDGLQRTIRERFRILGQVRSLTAQGKLSGIIVGLLPLALLLAIHLTNAGYLSKLFTEKTGRILLASAGGLQLIGVFFIRKIVDIEV
jgi:tight adherence protein B